MRNFLAAVIFFLAWTPVLLHAQATREIIYKAGGNMTASGNFPDSLMQYDKKAGLSYLVANDSNNLYVFIKVRDRRIQNKVIVGGITTAINAKGKKKTKTSITFPVVDQQAYLAQMRSFGNTHTKLEDNEIMTEHKNMLSRLNEIKVSGLRDINNGTISTLNQYGIRAKISYDTASDLVYELSIPFKYAGVSMQLKNDVAVNIRVNGFSFGNTQRPEGSGMRSGPQGGRRMGGGRMGGGRGMGSRGGGRWQHAGGHGNGSAARGPADFWVKAQLAR